MKRDKLIRAVAVILAIAVALSGGYTAYGSSRAYDKQNIWNSAADSIAEVNLINSSAEGQDVTAAEATDSSTSGSSTADDGEIFINEGENIEWPEIPQEPYGKSAILIEPDTGAVLYSKNPDEKLYPASITKIMTALLAVENLNLSDTITITGEMLAVLPSDAAIQGIQPGEVITVRDCLYSLLLRSSGDVAVALAFAVAGSEEEFAKMMTERAKSIGAVNTNFVNSTGLHDDNHYTTARDMVLIAKEAMSNPTFAAIWGAEKYTMTATNMEESFTIWHRHDMLVSSRANYYQYATGGKTGYTDEAGRTLVTSATKDGLKLIAVIMFSTNEDIYNDTKELFNYGFNNFKKITISGNEERFGQSTGTGFSIVNTIYGSKSSLLTIGTGSAVIPKTAQLSRMGYQLDMSIEDTGKGEVARLTYMNGTESLGNAVIYMSSVLSDNKSDVSSLEKKSEEAQKTDLTTVFSINIYYIAGGVAAVIVIILVVRILIRITKRRRIGKKYYTK